MATPWQKLVMEVSMGRAGIGLEDSLSPEVLVPASQFVPAGAELVVRSTLAPDVLAPTLMRTLRGLNPGQATEQLLPRMVKKLKRVEIA
jgi:hypothetical protein